MKINPIGINAYQQVARTSKTAQQQNAATQAAEQTKLRIQPQNPQAPSRLAIKPHLSNIDATMTTAERNALENLIKIVNEKGTLNAGYSRDNRTVENPEAVGNFIDVKV